MLITALPTQDFEPDDSARPIAAAGFTLLTDGGEMPWHRHRRAQVFYNDSGLITCETEEGVWVIPPQGAVWIPGGLMHRSRCAGEMVGVALFVEPDAITALPDACCSLAVSPLLAALLMRAVTLPALYDEGGTDGCIVRLLFDELAHSPVEQVHLPRPADSRLRLMTDGMLGEPADRRTLAEWAGQIGMSERSLRRLFQQETGMSIGHWRRQMHVVTGVQLLAHGLSLQNVAHELGYESTSAFAVMFKKQTGKPPGRFLAERQPRSAARSVR